jgi:hypothetical protein
MTRRVRGERIAASSCQNKGNQGGTTIGARGRELGARALCLVAAVGAALWRSAAGGDMTREVGRAAKAGKPPATARAGGRGAVSKKFEAWINDPGKVMGCVAKYPLESMLDAGGGIVKISNFFPEFVADGILEALEAIPAKHWNVTEAVRDHASNNIAHKFWSSKTAPSLESIFRAVSVLQPGRLNTFSAGK